jgi:hypothetical protein
MHQADVIDVLSTVIADDGADEALAQIVEAGGVVDADVALLDGDLSVAEALAYAEALFAFGRDDAALEVIGETVRVAFRVVPVYAAA